MFYIGGKMLKQFLLNYKQELMERKIDLTKSFQNNEMLIKENEEYIRFVEASEDKNYGSFSPQSYNTNNNNLAKLKELKEKQKQLKEVSARKKEEIEHIDQRLSELLSIIEEVKNDEENRIQQDIKKANSNEKIDNLIHKIEFCINLVDVDPKRCKLELREIIKSL